MEAKVLANKIFKIKDKLEENNAVAFFAKEGWGFEKWLQVELCWILSKYGRVQAEKKRIDIIFADEWAISLKDDKAYFYEDRSSIFKNIIELKDKKKHYSEFERASLVFLTFPEREITEDKINIQNELDRLIRIYKINYHNHKDFKFNNNIKGRIWFVVG